MTEDDLSAMNAAAFHIARAYMNCCDPDPAVVRVFRQLSDAFLFTTTGPTSR
jgi:hypothetical protein